MNSYTLQNLVEGENICADTMVRLAILFAVLVAAYAREISNFDERGFDEAVETEGEIAGIDKRYSDSTGVLDWADKVEILDKHNELRAAVSPTASNMKKMVSTNTTDTLWYLRKLLTQK